MIAEAGRVQSMGSSGRSPFAELAETGSMKGKDAPDDSAGSAALAAGKPPRPRGSGAVSFVEAHQGASTSEDGAVDSPVSGLVDGQPMATQPSGILKEEGSVRGGMRRAVSWADFSHEDPTKLTEVVEFERDGPSSPTSLDSWGSEPDEGVQCACCSLQ